MFGNNLLHEVVLSHVFDVAPNWRDVQEKRRQLWDSHLLHFQEELVPWEPAWLIHKDQDIFNNEEARKFAPELFKGGTTSKTMGTIQSMFGDLEVADSHLDDLNAKVNVYLFNSFSSSLSIFLFLLSVVVDFCVVRYLCAFYLSCDIGHDDGAFGV